MIAEVRQSIATLILKSTKGTNLARWRHVTRFDLDWNERVALIGSLIAPESVVLEFGAGRQILQSLLPQTCTYIASDVIPRNEKTFVCDLNASNLPTLPLHDTAVFSGVLEYIHDVPRVLDHLMASTEVIIPSYAPCRHRNISTRYRRLVHGWVNAYTKSEFEQLFETRGYRREAELPWKSQFIWRFRKVANNVIHS